ncbi:MAG: hypothetical protein GQ570_03960 [Helicobacteraceae bacterium]|nr:hypothetical protein [Helicobacteraceae bacterium]
MAKGQLSKEDVQLTSHRLGRQSIGDALDSTAVYKNITHTEDNTLVAIALLTSLPSGSWIDPLRRPVVCFYRYNFALHYYEYDHTIARLEAGSDVGSGAICVTEELFVADLGGASVNIYESVGGIFPQIPTATLGPFQVISVDTGELGNYGSIGSISIFSTDVIVLGIPYNTLSVGGITATSTGVVITLKKTTGVWAIEEVREAASPRYNSYYGEKLTSRYDPNVGETVLAVLARGDLYDRTEVYDTNDTVGAVNMYTRNTGNTGWDLLSKVKFHADESGYDGFEIQWTSMPGVVTYEDGYLILYYWDNSTYRFKYSKIHQYNPATGLFDIVQQTWPFRNPDDSSQTTSLCTMHRGEGMWYARYYYQSDYIQEFTTPVNRATYFEKTKSIKLSASDTSIYREGDGVADYQLWKPVFKSPEVGGDYYLPVNDGLTGDNTRVSINTITFRRYSGVTLSSPIENTGLQYNQGRVDVLADHQNLKSSADYGPIMLHGSKLYVSATDADYGSDGNGHRSGRGLFSVYDYDLASSTHTFVRDISPNNSIRYILRDGLHVYADALVGPNPILVCTAANYNGTQVLLHIDTVTDEILSEITTPVAGLTLTYSDDTYLALYTNSGSGVCSVIKKDATTGLYTDTTGFGNITLPQYNYTSDYFGTSFHILKEGDNPIVAIGATGHDWDATISSQGTRPGAVYIYELGVGGAGELHKVTPPVQKNDLWLGTSMAMVGDLLLVGASGNYYNVDTDTYTIYPHGSVYVYKMDLTTWGSTYKYQILVPGLNSSQFRIGISLYTKSDKLFVPSAYEDTGFSQRVYHLGQDTAKLVSEGTTVYTHNTRVVPAGRVVGQVPNTNRTIMYENIGLGLTISGVTSIKGLQPYEYDHMRFESMLLAF